ncbi:MAG: BatA domain-containing protein, partial [Bacteroidota bacterium]
MIQFKHPDLLWALVLLIIPILIHLFHLRRFKKTPFTNVAFLKNIKITTRKSSQLKKWLVLLTRLGMLAFVILAFAQPFLPNTDNFNKPTELVIYLDNSFSMQAKGSNGSLLNEAKQQLLNYLPEEEKFTLYTNDRSFVNTSRSTIMADLIDLGYSNNQLAYDAAYLKGLQYFKAGAASIKNLIFISDFQQKAETNFVQSDSTVRFGTIQIKPQKPNNISIDSVYFQSSSNKKEMTVKFSNYGDPVNNVAVSLYNDDQ